MDNLKLDLELTVAQVNVILKYIGKGVYEEVADVIAVIHAQAKGQLELAASSSAEQTAEELDDTSE